MKKQIIWFIGLCVFLGFFATAGNAQNWYGIISYQIGFPSGDTKDFVDATSFRGFGMGFRKTLDSYTTVGFTLDWNVFYERTRETVQLETENPGAITGVQDRYLNSFPIMLNIHRYFAVGKNNKMFVGLNGGGYLMTQRMGIGIFEFQNDEWEWGIAPEAGVIVPISLNASLVLTGRYNYAFTGELPTGAEVNHQYWNIGIGIAWQQF